MIFAVFEPGVVIAIVTASLVFGAMMFAVAYAIVMECRGDGVDKEDCCNDELV